jgi:hypothetical protein
MWATYDIETFNLKPDEPEPDVGRAMPDSDNSARASAFSELPIFSMAGTAPMLFS